MNTIAKLWQPVKALLPLKVLNLIRYFYSPGHRMSLHAERVQRHVQDVWPKIEAETKRMVLGGPFRGMRYITEAAGSALAPKILGTYEMELHSIVETIVAREPSCIIDIGAAEGFYAVGLAMRLPSCRMIAFESDAHAHELLRQFAANNGMDARIEIHGHCTPETLGACMASLPSDVVVICDAEGAELSLLDPARLPMLMGCSILVELHPAVERKIKSIFFSRFGDSSVITAIKGRGRVAKDFPEAVKGSVSNAQKLACMDEVRPCRMEWLWIEPRSVSAASGSSAATSSP